MFGMEKSKQNKGEKKGEFLFDMEKELHDVAKQKEHAKHIEERVHRIKELLRSGKKKEEFDDLGTLLNGYHAMAVVFGKAAAPKK